MKNWMENYLKNSRDGISSVICPLLTLNVASNTLHFCLDGRVNLTVPCLSNSLKACLSSALMVSGSGSSTRNLAQSWANSGNSMAPEPSSSISSISSASSSAVGRKPMALIIKLKWRQCFVLLLQTSSLHRCHPLVNNLASLCRTIGSSWRGPWCRPSRDKSRPWSRQSRRRPRGRRGPPSCLITSLFPSWPFILSWIKIGQISKNI